MFKRTPRGNSEANPGITPEDFLKKKNAKWLKGFSEQKSMNQFLKQSLAPRGISVGKISSRKLNKYEKQNLKELPK